MSRQGVPGGIVLVLSSMLIAVLFTFALASDSGPLDAALRATEAPPTMRAAFTAQVRNGDAMRIVSFDPRREPAARWQVEEARGGDPDLDEIVAHWAGEPAPDGRLFPDDLRASLSQTVEVEDLGQAWRVRFRHQPSMNDGTLDVWATETLSATAWLDPVSERFVRIDHVLAEPVRGPDGGRLTRWEQSYFLETEPSYGLSFVSGFVVDIEARGGFRRFARRYSVRIVSVEFFFASAADERRFLNAREGAGLEGDLR